MKIAFLSPEYVTPKNIDGGLGNYLKTTAKSLTELGHHITIFLSSDRDFFWNDGSIVLYEIKKDNLLLNFLSKVPGLRAIHPLLLQWNAARKINRKLWKLYPKEPFDVIHSASYTAPGVCTIRNKKVPVVCRVSSYTPLLRSAYGRKRGFIEKFIDWMEVRQIIKADASFAPSMLTANIFEKMEGHNLGVIYSPLHFPEVEPDVSFFKENRPAARYLLFFGTLSKIKGVDLIGEIIDPILERHKDLSFVFIGRDDGLPDGRKCFEYILSRNPLHQQQLFYFPAMQKSRLHPFILNAEAVLIPSRIDNYPNACLEAQILGIPVVGSYESSLDEMIIDGVTGFLAENSSSISLQMAVEKLLKLTAEERKGMRKNILMKIEEIKNEDRVGKLISFYRQTIENFNKR